MQLEKKLVLEEYGLKITGRRQAQITSATDEGIEIRESDEPINITKVNKILIFNEASLHLLTYF